MIQILPQTTGNVVAVRINGRLVHEDYQQFIPRLEAILGQYGSLRCYCEMTNFEGFTWRAMLDEMKFDMKHWKQIERCAIVGDSSWNPWMTKFAKTVFGSAKIKSFTPSEAMQAWNWVTENSQYADTCCGVTGNTVGKTSGNHGSYASNDTWGDTTGTSSPTCGQTN